MQSKEADVVDIIKKRYRNIEESLGLLNNVLKDDPAKLENDIYAFGFRGITLFLLQSLLDLSNALLISRDITPTSYRDLFSYLINSGILDKQYQDLLDRIIDVRNILLFGHEKIDTKELFEFMKENFEKIKEIFHSIIKLLGEL